MPKKVRPGSKRLPPWQTPQTQCRGSYSRKMSKKGVFEQAKDTFSRLRCFPRALPAGLGGSPALLAPGFRVSAWDQVWNQAPFLGAGFRSRFRGIRSRSRGLGPVSQGPFLRFSQAGG